MRILLLNWAEGENDPFSYFSAQFQSTLQALGHDVAVVQLDGQTGITVAALHQVAPFDLAFCWQGLGSGICPAGREQTLWEILEIPIACLHGDHPCYMPPNHAQASRFHYHLYSAPAFVADANRLLPRRWPALQVDFPNFFAVPKQSFQFAGELFVLPKNLTDLDMIRRQWRKACDPATYQFLDRTAGAIEEAFRTGNHLNHSAVIWQCLPPALQAAVGTAAPDPVVSDLIFRIMRELDRVHRNVASMFILDTLIDVPIHVIGRGWDRFKERRNPNHRFSAFDTVASGDSQFLTAYGILDVAPSNESLHDRCWRAIRKRGGFLISSSWKRGDSIHDDFSDLFFDGSGDTLRTRIDGIRSAPERHRDRVAAFGEAYDARFSCAAFLASIRTCVLAREGDGARVVGTDVA